MSFPVGGTPLTSNITFGTYNFPITAWVKGQELSSDLDKSKMLGLDGEFTPAGVAQAQKITVSCPLGGDGTWDPVTEDYIVTFNDLATAANNMFALLEDGYAALNIGTTPARTIIAQKESFKIAFAEASGRRHAEIDIAFYAQDPRWLATTPQTITSNGAITNNGNMVSYPTVTYTQTGGAASQPVSLQVYPGSATGTGGAPYVELLTNLTLASGDVLVISCDPRLRSQGIIYTPSGGQPAIGLKYLGTTGIINTVGNDATFPYLLPGSNFLKMFGANSMSFVFSDAFAL